MTTNPNTYRLLAGVGLACLALLVPAGEASTTDPVTTSSTNCGGLPVLGPCVTVSGFWSGGYACANAPAGWPAQTCNGRTTGYAHRFIWDGDASTPPGGTSVRVCGHVCSTGPSSLLLTAFHSMADYHYDTSWNTCTSGTAQAIWAPAGITLANPTDGPINVCH